MRSYSGQDMHDQLQYLTQPSFLPSSSFTHSPPMLLRELPFPATKLFISQRLWVHPSLHSWAWLIVASYLDSENCDLWQVQQVIGCRDITLSGPTETSTPGTIHDHLVSNVPIGHNTGLRIQANRTFPDFQPRFPVNTVLRVGALQQTAMSNGFGSGWHPVFGADPESRRPVGTAMPGSVPGVAFPGSGGFTYYPSGGPFGSSGMATGGTIPGPNNQGPVYVIPQNGYNHPVPVFPGQAPRMPNPHPVVDPSAPALNMNNSTGGVGCEPGYNYFFSGEHTKLHVVKSSTAPWQLPAGMSLHFGAYHVPANTTLAELLKGFGATNAFPKKNKVTELIQGGNGKWYKGVTFSGDQGTEMKQTLRDLGWDGSRTGRSGDKPVIWLWITKD
ncbi:hypothetical protein GGR54DRAFT_633245 [Hypoxylon sp. NC1633]|nr:hypothetical protein GGR54DRAFT_633245 [Hypoxylon sp. NC1633]